MKDFFGSNSRFRVREHDSHWLMTLDVKGSRKAQAQWSAGIWKRVVNYANATLAENEDVKNIIALMHEFGWSPPAELMSRADRREYAIEMAKEAQKIRMQVGEILCWIASPGKNVESDRHAVEIISERSHGIKLQLVSGQVVARSFGTEHFLDSVCRFICDSLHQISKDLARLPEPGPIRICEMEHCASFFVRDRKHLFCEKHRGVKASRSADENRRYKFIRDNLRIPTRKLVKKIVSGRHKSARDGEWKERCLAQIHIDRNKGIKKRPTDYLHTD